MTILEASRSILNAQYAKITVLANVKILYRYYDVYYYCIRLPRSRTCSAELHLAYTKN